MATTDLADRASLALITEDLLFFRDTTLGDHIEAIRPVAWLALIPWLSAFVFESSEYFERRGLLSFQDLRPHDDLLRASRLRLKLLDDDHRSFDELLTGASDLAAINSDWFLEPHRRIVGRIKGLLQPDLGIYFVHGEVICTTHVAFLNFGLTKEMLAASSLSRESLGPYLRDTTEDFGRYMRILLDALGIDVFVPTDVTGPSMPLVGYRDLKSKPYYETLARRIAPEQIPLSLLLTSILSQVNTARILIPLIAGRNQVAVFKSGFISLYHAASSLQRILNLNKRSNLLQSEAERQISAVLGDEAIRNIRKNSRLRNTLFHYGVDERMAASLSPDFPLFGLIEAHCSGKSFASVSDDVQQGLSRVANGLSRLLVEGITPQDTL